jgi:hypothetical protein
VPGRTFFASGRVRQQFQPNFFTLMGMCNKCIDIFLQGESVVFVTLKYLPRRLLSQVSSQRYLRGSEENNRK